MTVNASFKCKPLNDDHHSFNRFYVTKYFTQISTLREHFGHKTCFIAWILSYIKWKQSVIYFIPISSIKKGITAKYFMRDLAVSQIIWFFKDPLLLEGGLSGFFSFSFGFLGLWKLINFLQFINPFSTNIPLLYPLKTSENIFTYKLIAKLLRVFRYASVCLTFWFYKFL